MSGALGVGVFERRKEMEWLSWFGLTVILFVVLLLLSMFDNWLECEDSTFSTIMLCLFFAAYMAYNIVFHGRLF